MPHLTHEMIIKELKVLRDRLYTLHEQTHQQELLLARSHIVQAMTDLKRSENDSRFA